MPLVDPEAMISYEIDHSTDMGGIDAGDGVELHRRKMQATKAAHVGCGPGQLPDATAVVERVAAAVGALPAGGRSVSERSITV